MVEVPLLFEAGMESVFDTTVAVVTADEVRRERAAARGHALVDEREARQLTQDEKAARAEHVIDNDGIARGSRAGAVRAGREAARDEARRRSRRRRRRSPARRASRSLAGVVVVGAALVAGGTFDQAIQELTLPLRHEDVIRQQADEKDVDAALIAAVIYSESKFSDQTSSAGARGLMQITPEAANDIERHSGGTTFELEDLSDPEINIRYGTFLLRELLDRYDGDEAAALAAYNAGPGNADEWGGSRA